MYGIHVPTCVVFMYLRVCAQSCPALCDPMGPPGSSAHGILQARILEWAAMPSSRGSSPGIEPRSPALQVDSLLSEPPAKPIHMPMKNGSRPVVPDSWRPLDYTIHGILQAKTLEWAAFPFSRGSSQPRDGTQVSHIAGDSLPAELPGKPHTYTHAKT